MFRHHLERYVSIPRYNLGDNKSGDTKHGHDVWKNYAWAVVLVGIKENSQSLEFVNGPENRASKSSLLRDPHGHPIAVEVSCSMNFELELNLLPKSLSRQPFFDFV